MTITNNIAAKAAVAFVAVAMAFSLVAPAAQAQDVSSMSLEQLIALVNSLQTQLSGSASSSSTCSFTFTRSLGTGSTGADVMNLQKFLNSDPDLVVSLSGAGSPGMESSFYGPLTAAAVSKFQTKYSADVLVPVGLTSPTGYFGPSSMSKANKLCDSTSTPTGPGTPDDSDELEGGAGSLSDVDFISSLSNEEVGEDQEDVEVAGLEIEAEGSDIELRAVNLNFSQGTAGSDFDKYAEEVSIWFDGEEVARVDADQFKDDDLFDKTVTLDSGAIIREDDTGELVVAVSGISNLDSTDATDTWTVEFESVRFADAQGGIITDSSTGDINDGTGRTFSFESFATASDLELKVTAGDDDINDARTIEVSDTSNTDNVDLHSFNIEIEGNSDVDIDDISVDFTAVGAGVGEIINSAEILVDGEVVGSETIASTSATTLTVTFDSLDWQIEAGDTVEVTVRVDVNDIDGGFSAGDTLMADVNPDDAAWDVEDENGDDLAAGDKTGSATSEAHAFYAEGINVSLVSTTATSVAGDSADDDYATLTIKFDVTAFGEKAYIDKTVSEAGTSTNGTAFGVDLSTAAGTYIAAASTTFAFSSTGDEDTNGYEVLEGTTETFTLVVTVQNAATSTFDGTYVRAVLTGLGFNSDDSSTFTTFTSDLASTFKTDTAFIAN